MTSFADFYIISSSLNGRSICWTIIFRHPNVYVKISALFRNIGDNDSFPYNKVKSMRFVPLLDAYGADRLMMGSDFPFVLETEGSYKGAIETVQFRAMIFKLWGQNHF